MLSRLHVGCYTGGVGQGIHVFDAAPDGTLEHRGTAVAEEASFLAVRADLATVYAVRETSDTGAVVAHRPTDRGLEPIGEVPSLGAAPCHVSTQGDRLYVANYGSGDVGAYALGPDGTIGDLVGHHRHVGSGPHPRQEGAHAHCIVPSPDGRWVYAVDLGTDRVVRYDTSRFDRHGETTFPAGSGPRHLAFHPTLPTAYVVGELDCTVVAAHVDERTGDLRPGPAVPTVPTVPTRPADVVTGSTAAAVVVHPHGHRVYVSTRGHDTIATFDVDPTDGTLEPRSVVASGGRTPRHIALHPSGDVLYAAHQDSDTIVAFELVDGAPARGRVVAEVPRPVCLVVGAAT